MYLPVTGVIRCGLIQTSPDPYLWGDVYCFLVGWHTPSTLVQSTGTAFSLSGLSNQGVSHPGLDKRGAIAAKLIVVEGPLVRCVLCPLKRKKLHSGLLTNWDQYAYLLTCSCLCLPVYLQQARVWASSSRCEFRKYANCNALFTPQKCYKDYSDGCIT